MKSFEFISLEEYDEQRLKLDARYEMSKLVTGLIVNVYGTGHELGENEHERAVKCMAEIEVLDQPNSNLELNLSILSGEISPRSAIIDKWFVRAYPDLIYDKKKRVVLRPQGSPIAGWASPSEFPRLVEERGYITHGFFTRVIPDDASELR